MEKAKATELAFSYVTYISACNKDWQSVQASVCGDIFNEIKKTSWTTKLKNTMRVDRT